ncbi:hypothetical protein [Streptomyces sp. SCSIO ZS0520]|uniref:hypothetical protein n=1 Tax=Streptomyces sp. SCSIO ZS0520 TaxID=2892996 RepID=UPI0021D83773|nr:hypothetical protein [Streptomyces sp. SCSIO ZS0520]
MRRIDIHLVSEMPHRIAVWVDCRPERALVYVAEPLHRDAQLTAEGTAQVTAALVMAHCLPICGLDGHAVTIHPRATVARG